MIRAIATLLLTLALAAACSGAAPAATPTPTPTTAGVQSLRQGALEPGRYTTTVFQPKLTMTLGEGWTLLFVDDDDEVAFDRSGPAFLGMTRVAKVVDPATRVAINAPDDLAGWLSAHPALTVQATEPATIGGLSGTMLEATVHNAQSMDTFAYPTGNMHVVGGDRVRYYVLGLDGPDLTIIIAGGDAAFDNVMGAAQPVLDSLEVAATP